MIRKLLVSAVLALVLTVSQTAVVLAVTPDEVLSDAALEARARDLSLELRCLVCQNQSIDDSDADLAKDLRLIVRERLIAGDTDAQVIDFVVDRYGEFVLLKPRFSARNLALWGTPLLVLLLGGFAAYRYSRPQRQQTANTILSSEEEARLSEILDARDR